MPYKMQIVFKIPNSFILSLFVPLVFLSSSLLARDANVNQIKHSFVYNGDCSLSIEQIATSSDYTELIGSIPNLGVDNHDKYLKFFVYNNSFGEMSHAYFLNTSIDSIELYKIEDKISLIGYDGAAIPYSDRLSKNTGFLFDLKLNPNEGSWYLCKLHSGKQLIVPILMGNEVSLIKSSALNDSFMSLYFGIILVLIIYNFFLGISTKDNEYYYYVAYLLSVGLTQAALLGYGNRILWPYSSWLSVHGVHLTGALSGVFTILFVRKFVHSKMYSPIIDRILLGYIGISFLSIGFLIYGNLVVSYNLINFNAASSLLLLLAGINSARKGFHSARYFIVAWSVFLIAVTVFALKDFGVLPLNTWTTYSLPIGSALEGILLSFALAGKINTLKKEKEQATAELLETVQNQNEILEIKVHERTEELEQAKDKIQTQYDDLREFRHSTMICAWRKSSLWSQRRWPDLDK